jgi:aminoglycoside phosphotransferase (APT) family kinase protein
VSWPDADVTIDRALVQRLVSGQHPDLAGLPLEHLDAGWDNVLWRLGPDLVVRLPRRGFAVPLVESEQRWLPELAPRLPLPVPAPVRVGRPSPPYPWPWSIVPWLAGEPGDRAPLTAASDAARRLAAFLDALHHEAPPSAPTSRVRGMPLVERADTFATRLAGLADHVDAGALRAVWDAALAAPVHSGPPLWVHGDLHPANVLVADGTLAAVIDFGDLSAGDPANDLAAAWLLLPDGARDEFWRAYPRLDAALVARSAGWALLLGLMLLEIGLGGRPTYERVARATLTRLTDAGAA